jgi:Na+/H+-dicarboxylate symporter
MQKGNRLTVYILLSMVIGVVIGYMIHINSSPEFIAGISVKFKILTTIFLRLVQMIIAPLVFSTLVVGIAKLGDLKTVGRVGGKALLWFITASLISLLIGMFWVNILHPGTVLPPARAT